MPKRIPTPPPADDEPRYLTVVHPYVLDGHCNMELPKDRQDFARWVACCIDAKYVYAFFHKPSARDMVIIEVARECPQLDRLLGEHRWSEFLKKPAEQDKDQVSKVFYCTYSTGRQVQKNVGNAWKAAIATSSPAISGVKKQPAIGGGPIAVKASDVWVGLPVLPGNRPNGWVDTPAGSGANTPTHGTSSPLPIVSQNQIPDVPPGLGAKQVWSAGTSHPARPPGIPAVPNAWGTTRIETAPSLKRDNTSWSSSGRSSSTGTDVVLTPEDDVPQDPYKVHVTISDSMERALDALSVNGNSYTRDDPDLAELDAIAPGSWEPTAQGTWSGYPEADGVTWDDTPVDAEAQWTELQAPKTEQPIICNAHGIICKKGICREYAKQLREAERAKNEPALTPKKGRARGRGGAFGRGGRGGGGAAERDAAPANAFRGRGAAVRTNWRGTPRAIVSAASIEQRENVKETEAAVETPDAWGNASDAAWKPAADKAPEPSEDGWGGSIASYDPWSTTPVEPMAQAKPPVKPPNIRRNTLYQ
ncbi:hypothetical protein M405DRAFT_843857 [Rhizopogon salebrosus TDB-379]|nr:hypothetical protein M405DRAFT_843857 [Rhizopogon salebrosus TDB-379]